MKRNIFDLCTDTKDCYLAVIEVRILSEEHLIICDHLCVLIALFLCASFCLNRTRMQLTWTQCVGSTKWGDSAWQRKRRMRTIRWVGGAVFSLIALIPNQWRLSMLLDKTVWHLNLKMSLKKKKVRYLAKCSPEITKIQQITDIPSQNKI